MKIYKENSEPNEYKYSSKWRKYSQSFGEGGWRRRREENPIEIEFDVRKIKLGDVFISPKGNKLTLVDRDEDPSYISPALADKDGNFWYINANLLDTDFIEKYSSDKSLWAQYLWDICNACEEVDTLINCHNCNDSYNLTNCDDCQDCYDCKDCKDCFSVESSTRCIGCSSCEDCTDCKDCKYSQRLVDCKNCEDCKDLSNVEDYKYNQKGSSEPIFNEIDDDISDMDWEKLEIEAEEDAVKRAAKIFNKRGFDIEDLYFYNDGGPTIHLKSTFKGEPFNYNGYIYFDEGIMEDDLDAYFDDDYELNKDGRYIYDTFKQVVEEIGKSKNNIFDVYIY